MISEYYLRASYKEFCNDYGTSALVSEIRQTKREDKNRKKYNFPEMKIKDLQIKRQQRMLTEKKDSPTRTLRKCRKMDPSKEAKITEKKIHQNQQILNKQFRDQKMQKNRKYNNKHIKSSEQLTNYVQSYLKQSSKIQVKKQKFMNMLNTAKALEAKNKIKSLKSIQSIIQNRRSQSHMYQASIPQQKITVDQKFSKVCETEDKGTQTEGNCIESRLIQVQIANMEYRQKIQKYQQILKEKNEIIQKYESTIETLNFYNGNQQILKLKQQFIEVEFRNIKYTQQYQRIIKTLDEMNKVNQNNEKQIQSLVKQRDLLQEQLDKYCKQLQTINEHLRKNLQQTEIINSELQHQKFMLRQQKSERTRLANERFNLMSRINLLQKEFNIKVINDSTLIQKINRLIRTVEKLDQKIEKNIDQIFDCLENINCENLSKIDMKKLYDEKIQYINHIYKENLIACEELNTELTIQLQTFLSEFKLFQINENKLRQSQSNLKFKHEGLYIKIQNIKKLNECFQNSINKIEWTSDNRKILEEIKNYYNNIKMICQ